MLGAVTALTPVASRERVATLDVLRGFALLGVLIGNLYWLYSGRMFEKIADQTRLDAAAHWFVAIFVESKAQTLLTMLFGFGFAAQLLRAQAREQPVMGVYLRRLVVLFGFGLLHVLLWWGDVTWTYAVAGFGLLLFQRTSTRSRLIWALLLTFVPRLVVVLPSLRAALSWVGPEVVARGTQSFLAAVHGKSFWRLMGAHVRLALLWEAPPMFIWYYPWLLGRFLLGYVAGTQRWFDDEGVHHLPLFKKLLVWGVIADLPNVVLAIVAGGGRLHGRHFGPGATIVFAVVDQVGLLGLTVAYVGAVVLLMQRGHVRRVLMLVAPAGRMPLTTYISQSVICTFIFCGWGLGWSGKLRSAGCLGLAVAIFALQVVACRLWLRRFRFGPLEWIWRALVYLRRPPMRV
jgi:uncharacterized protein